MLSDETLVKWARGETADGLIDADIALSRDVSTLMPLLYYMAKESRVSREGPPVFLEIGTADGSTALPLAKAASEVGGHLHSIDPSQGGCVRCHELVKHFGYAQVWTHHAMRSDDFFAARPDMRIDFAFIDGDHSWPVTRNDIVNCWRALWPGGVVFASDYDPLPEGFEPYEHETDYGQQCSRGVAKGFRLALPELQAGKAQMFHLAVNPNPSILIRKPLSSEVFA